jgi:hypothetical protein
VLWREKNTQISAKGIAQILRWYKIYLLERWIKFGWAYEEDSVTFCIASLSVQGFLWLRCSGLPAFWRNSPKAPPTAEPLSAANRPPLTVRPILPAGPVTAAPTAVAPNRFAPPPPTTSSRPALLVASQVRYSQLKKNILIRYRDISFADNSADNLLSIDERPKKTGPNMTVLRD